ncbi:hypothetical protein [Terricaulis silvestris]|nr:hypothetical protein [Terricaulis silvestris]
MAKIDGKSQRVTTADALVLVLIARAAKDVKAYEMLQDLRAKLGDTLLGGGGCVLTPEPLPDEEWIAREMEKNKSRERPVLPHELAEHDEAETQAAAEVSPEEQAFGDLKFGDL